jgi:hypothetical protein
MHQPGCRRGCSQGLGAVVADAGLAAVEKPHFFWWRAGAYRSTLYRFTKDVHDRFFPNEPPPIPQVDGFTVAIAVELQIWFL